MISAWHKYWKMGNGKYVFETKITTTRARCFKMKLYNSCLSCYLMYKIDVRTFFKRFPHMTVQFEICISLFSGIFFVTLAVFVCGIFCIIENNQYKIPFEALHMKTKLILKSKARHENYFSFDVYKIIAHIVYLVRLLDVCTLVGVRLDYI